MAHVLRLSRVSKRFGRVWALRGVSASVRDGAVVGLVGPNGAGKTTLIKVSLGLLSRDSGTVYLNGLDPLKDHRAREGVTVIFERPGMPDSIPVAKLLRHAARIYGVGERRVEEVIRVTGIRGHEWKPFSALSAGLKQRVAIAHALLPEPHFIIADEPTSNLDPLERLKLLNMISELNRDQGITFLISSHVLPEVLRVSSEIVVLRDGRVVFSGSVSDVVGSGAPRLARIRTPHPEVLAARLAEMGYECVVEGLSVKVRVKGGLEALLKDLASVAAGGLTITSIDLVEVGLEEMIGG